MKKIIPLAILAGICISIGCVVNLRVGGVAGAVLFAFGLTTVVYYGLKLYTGTAGFIRLKGDWVMLGLVLLGNIIGCLNKAGVIDGSDLSIAAAIMQGQEKDNKTFASYMGRGRKRPFFDWICEYVNR